MAKQRQAHLQLYIPTPDMVRFRALVQTVCERRDPLASPLVVKVLTEEPGQTSLGNPYVKVGVWFDGPASAYWFALFLNEAQHITWRQSAEQKGGQANG